MGMETVVEVQNRNKGNGNGGNAVTLVMEIVDIVWIYGRRYRGVVDNGGAVQCRLWCGTYLGHYWWQRRRKDK